MSRSWIAAALLTGAVGQGCSSDCDSLQEEARALRDEAARCVAGDECMAVEMADLVGANACLLPFQCTRALNAAADLEALGREARRLGSAYGDCGRCDMADCIDPADLVARCDVNRGRCVLEPAP